ncbi:viroplasmin family protein [Clostridium thermobutyricum]|uniref:ribonuclease H1 domain-containing protein n=1 Tax=Clostridium thermobutyricum TaxID=29372 RepID=UPI0018A9AC5F|nr:ribonuclease H family protein [Clostridium thermobutyricum]
MAGKFYSVYKGKSGEPKIFTSWDECKKEVIGFKGAIYKSFKTREEAEQFILLNLNSSSGVKKDAFLKEESFIADEGLTAYVDGSFSLEKKNYSYGMVCIENGEVVFTDNGVGTDKNAISLRNVSGEVNGAMKSVEYAIENNFNQITIVFDYQGIESWALGTWKRNNDITKNYNEFMQEKMKEIKINFKKVKGHSGDKFNDMADKLAKEALGII